ncbi:T9SS type A sorting domain-containing protein [Mesonia sp.]|uniref:T9SS type A sorting domain-containing protein n=1 Tax=Mesonia sp. TaxID=1960830 RepID=UPI003F95532E
MKRLLLFFVITFQINAFAQTANPTTLAVCDDDNDGFANFDLTAADAQVLGSQSSSDYVVSYYTTIVDADAAMNQLSSPYVNMTPYNETLFSRVQDIGTGNFATAILDLIVNDAPIANQAPELIYCEIGNGTANFDLTLNDSIILGTQNVSDFMLTYYKSQTDAENNTNEIVNPSSYTNTVQPQSIWVIVENMNTGCSSLTSFLILVWDCSIDVDDDLVAAVDEDLNNNGNLNDDDTDDGGLRNYEDNDDDGDGVLTADEDYNNNGDPTDDDTDNSGVADYLESNVTLAVNELAKAELIAYPNPANGILYINVPNQHSTAVIEIYSIAGKKIKTHSFTQAQGNYRLDVSDLTSGTYFVKLQTERESSIEKIVIK